MKEVIYIMSEYFAPYQNIGSIKFTKIAKFLSQKKDTDVYVFTRKWKNFNDELLINDLTIINENGGKVFFIDEGLYFSNNNKILNKIINLISRFKSKLQGYKYYYDLNQKASRIFVKKGLSIIKSHNLPLPSLILSTFDDWGGHYLAYEVKRIASQAKWIADFRDPVGAFVTEEKYRKLCDDYSMMVSKYADFITVVSEGLIRDLKVLPSTRIEVCTNGFDYDDCNYAKKTFHHNDSDKLSITYAGSFYNRSISPFLSVLKELIKEKKIDIDKIEFNYLGSYSGKMYEEVEKAGLLQCYSYKGFVSRLEAFRYQLYSDVLLAAVWNTHDYQGVISGKFIQYLQFEKPIIGIVVGDEPNSELKKLINKLRIGYCYEQANHNNDYFLLKEYILNLYERKMSGLPLIEDFNVEELNKFDLKNITEKYQNIYKELRN